MLEELATATPNRLFVTSLSEKGGDVALEGLSVSNEVISQFLRALDASPYFEAVFLKDIEAEKERDSKKNTPVSVTVKKFKLSARSVNPNAPKPEAKAPAKTEKGAKVDPKAPSAPKALEDKAAAAKTAETAAIEEKVEATK